MKKKPQWLLVLPLLILPVLLCGAIFWVQNAKWNRIEKQFRLSFERAYKDPRPKEIEVSVGNFLGEKSLGHLSASEAKAMATQVNLRKLSPVALSEETIQIHFAGDWVDFNVALDEVPQSQSSSSFSRKNDEVQWPGELTPDSCRLIRQRITARWKPQIALIREEIRLGQQ